METEVSQYWPTLVPIYLPTHFLDVGAKCTIVGWGPTVEGGQMEPNATIGFVQTIDLNVCQKNHVHMPQDSLCISANETAGPCDYDTGGPLISHGRLVGIMQPKNIKCDVMASPAITVDVYVNLGWIIESIPEDVVPGSCAAYFVVTFEIFLIFLALDACPVLTILLFDIIFLE